MNHYNISAIAVAVGLAFSTGTLAAEALSKEEHKARKGAIEAEYKTDKAGCDSLVDNAKDICLAEAKGKQNVAKADLEASYKPTQKTHYQARVAKAQAEYSVAREKCDDKGSNVKAVCVKEAKAAETTAKANAKAWMKTAEANALAKEQTVEANVKAADKTADARKDAATEKRDAEYAVAQAKCDTFASDTKDRCVADAKARFGKS
jgi:hypothetical protein